MKRIFVKAILLALIISAAYAQPALAYIDPNTGGLLFQLLAVVFASLSAILLFFSRQIRMFFARAMRSIRSRLGEQQESVDDQRPASSDTEQ